VVFLQTRPLGIADDAAKPGWPDVSGLTLLLAAGQTASPGAVSAVAVHAKAALKPEAVENAILVARTASPDLAPLMGRVRGLITDLGGAASHLASVAREHHVPALMDTGKATAVIADGTEITLVADEAKVYAGLVPELARKPTDRVADEDRGPIGRHLRRLLDRISPLNLTAPQAPEFTPNGCRTLHDLIRFAHAKIIEEMFNLSSLSGTSVVSRKMSANIPLVLHFIDLGGGLAPELTTCDEILPEHIRSTPMKALRRGFTHPGITWSGNVGVGAAAFGLAPAAVSFAGAALACVVLKLMPSRRFYDVVDWSVVVLLGALIPVAQAVADTGTAALIGRTLVVDIARGRPVPALVLTMVTTIILSSYLNNAATAAVMCPIAISAAANMDAGADPFLMAVAVGSSCAFMTPIAHQNNTLILGPGGFRFGDYWQRGLALEFIVIGVGVPMILAVWPL
jgi:phosphohistidine swiveling domain-containing protein